MYIQSGQIEPVEIIGGAISVYRGIWDNPEETINAIEEYSSKEESIYKFVKAATAGEGQASTNRTNYNLGLSQSAHHDESMRKIHNRYYEMLYATSLGYKNFMGIHDDVVFAEPFNILKYQGGQEYKAHYDGGSVTKRGISAILYLNNTYEGGEIEFTNFDIKIKPEPGTLILFPPGYAYTHIAHPVLSGTKYAIVTWLHDIVD